MATPKIPEPPHLVTDLKTLCLATIAAHWERFAEEARRKRQPHADYLADLVSFEVAKRRERRIQRRIQEARFPILKTLDSFDFSAQPGLDRDEVLELFRCEFIDEVIGVNCFFRSTPTISAAVVDSPGLKLEGVSTGGVLHVRLLFLLARRPWVAGRFAFSWASAVR